MDPKIYFLESRFDLKMCAINEIAVHLLNLPTQRPPIHQALSTNPLTHRPVAINVR